MYRNKERYVVFPFCWDRKQTKGPEECEQKERTVEVGDVGVTVLELGRGGSLGGDEASEGEESGSRLEKHVGYVYVYESGVVVGWLCRART